MLRGNACRRFRAGFEPGRRPGHRRACPACDAYAAAVEAAAAAVLPLPAGLERRLRSLGPSAAGEETRGETPPPALPLPSLPLPAGLERRLQAVARRPAAPPAWLQSPWPGLAASFALALLAQGLLGDPIDRAQPLAAALGETVSSALAESADRTQRLDETWVEPTVASARRRLGAARESVTAWAESAGAQARRLLDADPTE